MKSKKKQIKKDKPQSILLLEKAYKIKLSESEFIQNSSGEERFQHLSAINFSVNKTGEINGLNLAECEIDSVSPLQDFLMLEYLNLTNNRVADVSSLSKLTNLKYLFLGGNQIKELTPIAKLSELRTLIVWGNPLYEITCFHELPNLEEFYCQKIGIKDLTFVKKFRNLIRLVASGNVVEDIRFLQELKKIRYIDLENNQIQDISPLDKLESFVHVFLAHNLVRNISRSIAEKFGWLANTRRPISLRFDVPKNFNLSIDDNKLEYPPQSVLDLGAETVRDYYETSEKFGHAPLSEGRIIVIGDGSAGKSSLIERILYDTFEQGKNQTNGIKIQQLDLQHQDGRKLLFHIWDFGGQEIQHAVHKFFFTEGCLYILVLDNRKEEEPEYWLQQIESLGGSAPVLVVFNKHDDNANEIADRKFLKEKYSNIIGFFNTSCKTGSGIEHLKEQLYIEVVKLPTVDEQFPNNWFQIKKLIEQCTSGEQHYLDFQRYKGICEKNNASSEQTQKLLLKYFTTIGAVTWFGDTYLNFLHVLSPAWITQGVYKIITAKRTSELQGKINISDFEFLLSPIGEKDYIYDKTHYGYILSMMKKFDLCYTPDDKQILIPSAFGKVPKIEYADFRGSEIRTYILQFKDYMPLALIHRFIAKRLPDSYDNNYWYSGIVLVDNKSNSLAMIHADKEAKRIYVRIKGEAKLGMWEHVRRELFSITSSYANINYDELVSLDDRAESTVAYEDLISHIQANKAHYFHAKLQRDYNVGFLIGLFESKELTISKFKKGEIVSENKGDRTAKKKKLPIVVNILNNNSPNINSTNNINVDVDIDVKIVSKVSSELIGDATYLLEELSEPNLQLRSLFEKVIEFAENAKEARNTAELAEKGWGRKVKNLLSQLGSAGEWVNNVNDGAETLKAILIGLKKLAVECGLLQ